MSREVHVRFCESRAVRSRPATHPVVHCATERQARHVLAALEARMEQVGLRLHPAKTRIVCVPRAQKGEVDV
jgi:RNA-directed DNA polymerase